MTPLQDKLRAALREIADEIPAEPPPLRLAPRQQRAKWHTWLTPLAAAAVVVAIAAASLAVAANLKHQPATSAPSGSGSLPPYYVALTAQKPDPDIYALGATAAEVRSTRTGAVLAKVTPPRPYVSFTGVTGAADDRTFVLSAQGPDKPPKHPATEYYPAQRFFLLRIDPPGGGMSLSALPAGYAPANAEIHDMALSPDGTKLAADVGDLLFDDQLYVFNLATGTERAWSARPCPQCSPSSGGMGYGGVNVDALSWTADGQHVAFIWGNQVRLLDTRAPGSDLVTDSKKVATWINGQTADSTWRGAIITPDGRTVLGIEEIAPTGQAVRQQLVKFSAATGRATATLNNLDVSGNYEAVLYTNADGSLLVVTGTRPGQTAGILHDGRYTSIPWSPYIGVAAW